MSPAIKAVQRVDRRPVRPDEPLTGRIVLSEVGGRFWLHRVTQEGREGAQIAADNGTVNGWTPRGSIFGIVD